MSMTVLFVLDSGPGPSEYPVKLRAGASLEQAIKAFHELYRPKEYADQTGFWYEYKFNGDKLQSGARIIMQPQYVCEVSPWYPVRQQRKCLIQ